MTGLILLCVGLLGQWLLGIAIAELCLRRIERGNPVEGASASPASTPFAERAGLGIVLGIGATSGIQFLWSLCGGLLGRGFSLSITAIGFAAGGAVLLRDRQRTRVAAARHANPDRAPAESQERAWCRTCQWLIAGLFLFALGQSLLTPQRLWDERATFAIKGIVLWEDRSIHSRDLADPDFVQYHPRYPLLIPLAEQHVYALLGGVDDRLSKVIFPLLYFGMVLAIAGGLSRRLTAGGAWLFALLVATIPALMPWEYGFLCGQGDAPTACYHGLSALYLWETWERISSGNPRGWSRTARLAGLCGALAAFTKDEGIAFLLVDAIAVLIVIAFSRHRLAGAATFATVFGWAAVLICPWIVHRSGLPLTTEANYFGRASLASIVEKQAIIRWEIGHLAWRLFGEFHLWGLQWWLMLFGIVAAPKRALAGPQLILLLDVFGAALSLMLAGVFAETEVSGHIVLSSHRYLMQIAPIAVIFAAAQLGTRREST